MKMQEGLHTLDFADWDTTDVAVENGADRREAPLYSVADVSLYLRVPEKTLRRWISARSYQPLITPADGTGKRLSFFNLVEAHILKATRQRDEVPMSAIRDALDFAAGEPSAHPLITKQFLTEGRYLFEEKLGQLINSSKHGQLAFDVIMRDHLERIDRDSLGYPSGLYPFVPNKPASKLIVIKPGVSSGVPTVSGTGISILIVYGRFKAGDTIPELADDYELSHEEIEDAIAYLDAA